MLLVQCRRPFLSAIVAVGQCRWAAAEERVQRSSALVVIDRKRPRLRKLGFDAAGASLDHLNGETAVVAVRRRVHPVDPVPGERTSHCLS